MKKTNSLFVHFIYVLGICAFISAFILSLFVDAETHKIIVRLLPVLAMVLGLMDVIIALCYTKTAYHLFTGLFTIFWGTLVFMNSFHAFTFSLKQWWPIIGVSSGLFLYLSGLFRYKKNKIGFVIPSAVLFFMGIWFMLFSFKIIKIPFKEVALVGGPLLVVLLCIFCVVLLMLQKKYKSLIVVDDEADGFEDDDLTMDMSIDMSIEMPENSEITGK